MRANLDRLKSLPPELKAGRRFVVWKYTKPPADHRGKAKKPPFDPGTRKPASVIDPASWSDFLTALQIVGLGGFDGVGRVLTMQDGLVTIDVDDCRDPKTGELDGLALFLISALGSYAEVSPSGQGIHLWAHGALPPGKKAFRINGTRVEFLEQRHYVTLTGEHLEGTPTTIKDCNEDLASLYHSVQEWADREPSAQENQRKSEDGPGSGHSSSQSPPSDRFSQLWEGRWKEAGYPSRSEADLALCGILAQWTKGNARQMDKLFRSSGLFRPKWDEPHSGDGASYGEMTVSRAIEGFQKCQGNEEPFTRPEYWQTFDAAYIDDWPVEEIEWIVEDLLPRGRLALLAAPSQTGKSLLSLYLSACLASGRDFLNHFHVAQKRKVLYLAPEDPKDRPLSRLKSFQVGLGVTHDPCYLWIDYCPGLSLPRKAVRDYLERWIVKGGFEVVVLDSYQRATAGIESYDDAKQTPILHFLASLTRRLNITLVILDHLRKEPTTAKRQRIPTIDDVKGSGAKVQNSDVVFLLERPGNRLNIRCYSKDSSDSPAFAVELVEDSNRRSYNYIEDLRAAYTSHQFRASRDRDLLLQIMQPGEWYSMGQLRQISGKSTATLQRRLNELIAEGRVIKEGTYKSTRYQQITNTSGQNPSD